MFKLLQKDKKLEKDTEALIKEFTKTFRDTKSALLDFLRKYAQENSELDGKFFNTFTEIVDVLAKRSITRFHVVFGTE
ncbi:hypothetical protein KKG72_08800 [bacterium]|nr:hypothetical protein [bacterium]MBU1995135.1 hypothetical protein [bacterium]